MNSATHTNASAKSFTIEDIKRVEQLVSSIKASTDWVLASPDGHMWRGHPADLLNVLIPHHPLMQPLSFGEMAAAPQGAPK